MKTNSKQVFAMMICALLGVVGGLAIGGQQVKTPPGYVIAEAEITDPAALQDYGKKIGETLAPFNHHFVVRTSQIQAVEGDPPKDRFVIIEFDSVQKAREWYDSPAYAAIRPIRQRATKSRILIVEGTPPQ